MSKVAIIAVMLFALILLTPTNAATIHGTVYSWDTLEPVKKVIVTINTTPEQKMVSNGTYSFKVPNGSYVIKAFFKQDGTELYAEENITIVEDGSYVVDLILFPKLGIEDVEEIEFPKVDEGDNNYYLISIPILASILGFLYYLKRKERPEIKVELDELPEDLIEVVEIIKKKGGRITQKELRKKLGYSEAKMSLIIADLERRGIVEKVKKGRGNVIFLKD
ncbi:hypothetical protein DRP05_01365 [Archaeoglobales archaeon]|nr:MAG: hypothetical protein DRP05_01365 [Archaeoglobales archaeon]